MSLEGAIAVHRFGLGARPGEIDRASSDPKAWLLAQIETPADIPAAADGSALPPAGEIVRETRQLQQQQARARRSGAGAAIAGGGAGVPAAGGAAALKALGMTRMKQFTDEMTARFNLGFTSTRPFAERLVWFWSNHFTVSVQNGMTLPFAGAFEREAIRPYINGKFASMLLAVTSHPAMLTYFNNVQSIGPHSPAGERSQRGLNENLGRELMELYSLGVDGGYTQADVIALAKILTGWSIDPGNKTGFSYFPNRHEPGTVMLRGKTYSSTFMGGVEAVRDLARDPATARHIATKFATYFIADDPPADSVARLEKTFNQTSGDLHALAEAAVSDPAAWTPGPGKMRTPVEYVTASYRLLGLPNADAQDRQTRAAMAVARAMGEFPLSAPSPKGWPLTSDAWSGADAVLSRIEWAKQLGDRMPPGFDAMAVAEMGMGPLLDPATKNAMMRAQTPSDALAFLISSPEFQRR